MVFSMGCFVGCSFLVGKKITSWPLKSVEIFFDDWPCWGGVKILPPLKNERIPQMKKGAHFKQGNVHHLINHQCSEDIRSFSGNPSAKFSNWSNQDIASMSSSLMLNSSSNPMLNNICSPPTSLPPPLGKKKRQCLPCLLQCLQWPEMARKCSFFYQILCDM